HRRWPYPRQPAICLRRQPDKSIRPLTERASIRHQFFAALYLIALFAAAGRQAQAADGLSEAQIKAAYLYNFAKFVEWPDTAAPASTAINLCVIGNNVLDGALQAWTGARPASAA
ncbi:YfiR family protein, partial [Methylomonas koyamae]|uniref:YfiR family protein n=1 Tax=Methylomonas koyamae TaxID=702114 RepID=UPI000A68C3AE